jgi:hypothetical protein
MPMCAQKVIVKKVGTNRGDRYRLLAVAEPDEYKAAVLRRIADEADRNVLCTSDRIPNQPKQPSLVSTNRLG